MIRFLVLFTGCLVSAGANAQVPPSFAVCRLPYHGRQHEPRPKRERGLWFGGISDPKQRAEIVDYLKTLK